MKKIEDNAPWWHDISPDYLDKIQRIINLMVDKLLTNDGKPIIKIPIAPLQDIEESIRIDIVEKLSKKNSLFTVLNNYYKKLLRETEIVKIGDRNWNQKMDILKDAYYKFNITEEDLDKYILLELKNANVLDKLREVKKQIDEKLGNSNDKENDLKSVPALKLFLNGDRLCITGSAIENKTIEMRKIMGGSGSLIDPILKICKNSPFKFKVITQNDLESKTNMQSRLLLDNTVKNIPQFKGYLSNIGLKGNLKILFYGNSPEGLGIKFRTAITREEWNKLTDDEKTDIVNRITKVAVSK